MIGDPRRCAWHDAEQVKRTLPAALGLRPKDFLPPLSVSRLETNCVRRTRTDFLKKTAATIAFGCVTEGDQTLHRRWNRRRLCSSLTCNNRATGRYVGLA